MSRQWFRMYAEAVDDEKLRLLAFEDRWHFVALLCLKAQGTLDSDAPHRERRIALKLGLQLPQLDELKRRLIEVRLIDEDWQPLNWGKRQFESDTKTSARSAYIYFIGGKSGDVKIGYSKNPWARLVDINSKSGAKWKVLATVRTTSHSEVSVHHVLAAHRKRGEWFDRTDLIQSAIDAAASGQIKTEDELLSLLRSGYVAATNRTEQNRTDTEQNRAEQRERRATRLPDDFALTHERRLVAEAERLPAERTFEKFCNYWRSVPGAKGRKLDWDATWRNWCLTERDRNGFRQPEQPVRRSQEFPS